MISIQLRASCNSTNTSSLCIGTVLYERAIIVAGSILLILVTSITISILILDIGLCKFPFYKKHRYWIWDTVSLHCSSGWLYKVLAIVCGYFAMFMATMKTVEFFSHCNDVTSSIIFFSELISYLFLLCIGIFETHPHPKPRSKACVTSWLHFISAILFILINIVTNLLWSIACIQNPWDKETPIVSHFICLFLASIFSIIFILIQCIRFLLEFTGKSICQQNIDNSTWCIMLDESQPNSESTRTSPSESQTSVQTPVGHDASSSHMPPASSFFGEVESSSSSPLLPQEQNAETHSSNEPVPMSLPSPGRQTEQEESTSSQPNYCNCNFRRKNKILCVVSYIFEVLLIVSTLAASFLQIAIENTLIPFGITDTESLEDSCWKEWNS